MLRLPIENTSDKEKKMRHWNEAKIKEFADVKGGKRLPKGKQLIKEQNSHPYIRIRDLGKSKYLQLTSEYEYVDDDTQKSIARYIVNEGDILISVVGTIGLIGIVGDTLDKANQTENCDKIVNIKGIIPEYLYYYLVSDFGQEEIRKGTVGAVQPKLPLKNVQDISVRYPSIEEQEKIVSILSSIDEKIATNETINNNLEQQAKALYKDWFFDFTPFSTDGNLPDGWRLGTVSDIIQLHDSKRVPLSGAERDKMAKIYPYYGATSLMDYVDNYLFDGIYLLLGEDGTVVDSLDFPILQYVYGQFWVNNHAHIITGKEGFSVEELYLFFSLTNIKSIVTGAVQQKVSQQNLKKVPAIIPSKDALSAFDELIQPIFSQIRNLRDENARLADLRDTLLPKLMSGELDVSDIDH